MSYAGPIRSDFFQLEKRYGDMDASQLKQLKELEDKKKRLKRSYCYLNLDHELFKNLLQKKF